MEDKKQKIEIGKCICRPYGNCKLDRMECPYSDCFADGVAEKVIRKGYHKTIWHKVADGDLPTRDNKDIIAVPVQAHYVDRRGIEGNEPLYFFFIDNTFHSLNQTESVKVIAWTELPKYKE